MPIVASSPRRSLVVTSPLWSGKRRPLRWYTCLGSYKLPKSREVVARDPPPPRSGVPYPLIDSNPLANENVLGFIDKPAHVHDFTRDVAAADSLAPPPTPIAPVHLDAVVQEFGVAVGLELLGAIALWWSPYLSPPLEGKPLRRGSDAGKGHASPK